MKKYSIIFLLLFSQLSFSQSSDTSEFSKGYKAGYKKAFCVEHECSLNDYSILVPNPNSDYNSYEDGFARGIATGKADQIKNSKNRLRFYPNKYRNYPTIEMAFSIVNDISVLSSYTGISQEKIREEYGLNNLLISSHIKSIKTFKGNYRLFKKNESKSGLNYVKLKELDMLNLKYSRKLYSFSEVAIKTPLLWENQNKKPELSILKNINEFKYVVLLESKLNYNRIKRSLEKHWENNLPELIIMENEKSIPDDLKSNPNLAIYLDILVESFDEVFTNSNFNFYRNNSDFLYSLKKKRKSGNKAMKLLIKELKSCNYQYDESL